MPTSIRKDLIVTIDGPSGAGKSTVARMLAKAMGYAYIDTGAMYRGVAYAFSLAGEPEDLGAFLKGLDLSFSFAGGTRVLLGQEDISEGIRDPKVSLLASALSQKIPVREYLWEIQRRLGDAGGVVLEGRDTGSVVFPYAQVKFYIDANLDERARRRHLELASKGTDPDLATVEAEMAGRDRKDSEREIAPLVIPDGAIRIDTTGIDAEHVVEIMLGYVSGTGG